MVLSEEERAHIEPALDEVSNAIREVDWPIGSGSFTINPERKGNGVKPIKANCITYLKRCG